MTTKTVTDDSFSDDVLGASGPVLVDFWATWCGPCKQIAPALDEIATDMKDNLTVAKVDIDANPNTPGQYGVRGVPTLMLFHNGEMIGTKVGAAPKGQIEAWIKETIAA
ncbi:MAG: thioredoxin [Pseudomonadota bacterium]